MGLFVEYFDGTDDPLVERTAEMDYVYQAEQWAIDALDIPDIVKVKAFYGPRPAVGQKTHSQQLFAEWNIVIKNGKRDLERLC